MTILNTIHGLGQSLWYDNMRRGLIDSGGFAKLISDGIVGVTSNPAIFAAAIGKSTDYDAAIAQGLKKGIKEPKALYEYLAIDDIRRVTDLFRPEYDRTKAGDGYVSLEVSPLLAHDTAGSIAEAVRLHAAVDRPNVMIKVPATPEGLPVITDLIARGICVNVTLLFSVDAYEKVTSAYMAGLEHRQTAGLPLDKIASVASFFVSRIDSLVDELLSKSSNPAAKALEGQIAVANAYEAYAKYNEIINGQRWKLLAKAGAQPQRLLWASTSTKNAAYPKTKYVDALIAPHTVNTIPPETVESLLATANQPRVAFTADWDNHLKTARAQLKSLADVGISITKVTDQLLAEAITKFADPFNHLLASLKEKATKLAG
ncbi:MAG: transaldolase [Gemmatales bacterium]